MPLSLTRKAKKETADAAQSLFAGFISASLSMFEELENALISEFVFQSQKIVILETNVHYFLGITEVKVPTNVTFNLLTRIAENWYRKYTTDNTYLVQYTEKEYDEIKQLILRSISETFWWYSPKYTLQNNILLIKDFFTKASEIFYVSALPPIYVLTGMIAWLFPFVLSIILGTTYYGLSTNNAFPSNVFMTLLTIILIWIGTGTVMELIDRENFNLIPYLIVSGIYSLILIPMFIVGSYFYDHFVYTPLLNVLPKRIVSYFFFWLPYNLSFFLNIVIIGYASSYVQRIKGNKYFFMYLFAAFFMFSITAFFGLDLA